MDKEDLPKSKNNEEEDDENEKNEEEEEDVELRLDDRIVLCEDLSNFEQLLEKSAERESLVVVDFSATWCGPCKKIKPDFKELSHEYKDVLFMNVDVDEGDDIADKYSIESIPCFIFIKNSNEIDRLEGANIEVLKNKLEKYQNCYED